MKDTALLPEGPRPAGQDPSDLMTLSYRSVAKDDFTEPGIGGMVAQARRFNASAGITGVLLYDGRYFLQILEGSLQQVTRLFASIRQDGRHSEVLPFAIRWLTRRRFDDWSMRLLGPLATREVAPDLARIDGADPERIDRLATDVLGLLRR
ncbi:MAG: BLUF domain-containing protein [Rhodosalinus sp.]|uniref:BLUF domain-containing protein n=1 Tax=Rhodosalinus sp. TaxID=2047741 RepID=UPI00397E100D